MEKSTIERTRSGHFDLYLFGRYVGQYESFFKAGEAAREAGERRAFRHSGATTSATVSDLCASDTVAGWVHAVI